MVMFAVLCNHEKQKRSWNCSWAICLHIIRMLNWGIVDAGVIEVMLSVHMSFSVVILVDSQNFTVCDFRFAWSIASISGSLAVLSLITDIPDRVPCGTKSKHTFISLWLCDCRMHEWQAICPSLPTICAVWYAVGMCWRMFHSLVEVLLHVFIDHCVIRVGFSVSNRALMGLAINDCLPLAWYRLLIVVNLPCCVL